MAASVGSIFKRLLPLPSEGFGPWGGSLGESISTDDIEGENMIVNWKGERVLSVPVIEQNKKREGEIKDTSRVGAHKNVILIPGYNEVDENQWSIIEVHLDKYLKSGKLTTETKREKNDDEDGGGYSLVGVPLRRVPPSKARNFVIGCFNLTTLELWLGGKGDYEGETRDEIRTHIKEQIAKIKTGNENAAVGVA